MKGALEMANRDVVQERTGISSADVVRIIFASFRPEIRNYLLSSSRFTDLMERHGNAIVTASFAHLFYQAYHAEPAGVSRVFAMQAFGLLHDVNTHIKDGTHHRLIGPSRLNQKARQLADMIIELVEQNT